MAGEPERINELLRAARSARAADDIGAARAAYARTFDSARSSGDVSAMCEAALGLAGVQAYGVHAGRVPAYLFEAYTAAEGAQRIRLAVAIARTWVYGNDPARGAPFAEEALAAARENGDPALLAEALDATLLMKWGPDDFDDRLRITSQLEDAVAYLDDVEPRLSAHLWRLTTAVESLDSPSIRRQLSALSRLADETGSARVRFFERSRQAMYALVLGDVDAAREFRRQAVAAGLEAHEADVPAVEHTLGAQIARQTGDTQALLVEAAAHEEFGTAEGVPTVLTEAASLWLAAGEHARARALLLEVAGRGLATVPRQLDWLLIVTQLTAVATHAGERDLTQEGLLLLEPYAGRGVANGGGLVFAGTVDGYLASAAAALGRADDAARWTHSSTTLAERFNAVGRSRDLTEPSTAVPLLRQPEPAELNVVLRPESDDVWTVGRDGFAVPVREMKGFGYLWRLVRQPGVDLSAHELSDWGAGHPGAGVADQSPEPMIDRQALVAYRARLTDIDRELSEAQEWNDPTRIERLEAERAALLDEVGAATGLHGRARPSAGNTAQRARVAVRKALAAAMDRITEIDPVVGRILSDTVRTGTFCSYQPDPMRPVRWVTD